MVQCGTFGGKHGFYSDGGAQLLCSDCPAYFGCEKCCPSLSSTASTFSTAGPLVPQEGLSDTTRIILFTVLGAMLLAVLIYALKKRKSRRMHCARNSDPQNSKIIQMRDVPPVTPAPPEHEPPQEQVTIEIPEEDRQRLLGPARSVTCLPTQEQEGQKQKQYVPGQPLVHEEDEEEGL